MTADQRASTGPTTRATTGPDIPEERREMSSPFTAGTAEIAISLTHARTAGNCQDSPLLKTDATRISIIYHTTSSRPNVVTKWPNTPMYIASHSSGVYRNNIAFHCDI